MPCVRREHVHGVLHGRPVGRQQTAQKQVRHGHCATGRWGPRVAEDACFVLLLLPQHQLGHSGPGALEPGLGEAGAAQQVAERSNGMENGGTQSKIRLRLRLLQRSDGNGFHAFGKTFGQHSCQVLEVRLFLG